MAAHSLGVALQPQGPGWGQRVYDCFRVISPRYGHDRTQASPCLRCTAFKDSVLVRFGSNLPYYCVVSAPFCGVLFRAWQRTSLRITNLERHDGTVMEIQVLNSSNVSFVIYPKLGCLLASCHSSSVPPLNTSKVECTMCPQSLRYPFFQGKTLCLRRTTCSKSSKAYHEMQSKTVVQCACAAVIADWCGTFVDGRCCADRRHVGRW